MILGGEEVIASCPVEALDELAYVLTDQRFSSLVSDSLTTGPKRISHLGPEGTFTDQACHVYVQLRAPEDWERIGYPEMHQVVGALVDGEVDEAIVPIENSVGGAVIDIEDFLVRASDIQIKGEMLLGIEAVFDRPSRCQFVGDQSRKIQT